MRKLQIWVLVSLIYVNQFKHILWIEILIKWLMWIIICAAVTLKKSFSVHTNYLMFLSKRQSEKIGLCVITAVLTSVLMLCLVQVRNYMNIFCECTCTCCVGRAGTYHSVVFSQEQYYTIVHQSCMCMCVCAVC